MEKAKSSEPQPKRQRTSKGFEGGVSQRDEEIAGIQGAQMEGDALAAPSVRTSLEKIISSRKLSSTVSKNTQSVLKQVKHSLDGLQPGTWSATSKSTKKVLKAVGAGGSGTKHQFKSPKYKDLSVDCEGSGSINVVGSFILGYCTSNNPIIDVTVEMPSSMFVSKDYVNFKYHDKRLLYLIYLANHFLSASKDNEEKEEATREEWVNLSISKFYLAGNLDKPTLSLSSKEHPDIVIRIIPTWKGIFELSHLGDDRKNIRNTGESSVVKNKKDATVSYNHSILMDGVALLVLPRLYETTSSSPSFIDCILLLDSWNTRNRLNLSKFVYTVLLHDLISRKAISSRASKEQFFRACLSAISMNKLSTLSLIKIKVCSSIQKARLNRIKECARMSLASLESATAIEDPWYGIVPNLFSAARGNLKVAPKPLSTTFDGFIRIQRTESDMDVIPSKKVKQIEAVLDEALIKTGRILRYEAVENDWGNRTALLYGLTFNSYENLIKKVDILDGNNNDFWGEKISLRRFKDGKVAHSVIWSGGIQTLNEMLGYLFDKHLNDDNCKLSYKVHVGELEKACNLPNLDAMNSQIMQAFNEISTMLRSIEGLPLKIHSIFSTSPYLRRCALYAVRPNSKNRFIEPIGVVAAFESSGAWPNSPVAISASKAAFYVALRSKLAEKGVTSHATISFLEILLGGYVFRLRLKVEREVEVLPDGSEAKANLLFETTQLAEHHNHMRKVGDTATFQVCRLVKAWLNAQMLYGALGPRRDSIVELVVAYALQQRRCSSTMRGFFNVLHLFAEYPWEICPLVVSMLGDDDDEDEENTDKVKERENERCEAMRRAQKHLKRVGDAGLGIYAARGESVREWSGDRGRVEKVMVKRIQMTARAALAYTEGYLQDDSTDSWDGWNMKTLFAVDAGDFDVEVVLEEGACTGKLKGATVLPGLASGGGRGLLAGLDPIERVWTQLEERVGRWAIVMGRLRCSNRLYAVWRPEGDGGPRGKFALRDCAMADLEDGEEDEATLQTSREQLLAEMQRCGQGLVKSVAEVS